jgi:hydrogenase small subunit
MAQKSRIEELHILWISEGMSCDGDSVAMTAAMQPSIEDIVLGLIPGIPKVHVHNKVLDPATGDDLVAPSPGGASVAPR